MAFSLFEAKSVPQAQDLLQTLMDTTPDHIYFKDRDCRFIRVSKSRCELCGYDDPSRMIGKTDFDLFSKEHAEQAYADEQTIMRTGRMIKKEERETWSERSDTWAYSIKAGYESFIRIKDERGRHFDPRIVDAFLNRELEFRKVSDEMAD